MYSLSISHPPRIPALPLEVCEHIIDGVANGEELPYEIRAFLLSLSLVCHSWAPRARYHLLKRVELYRSSQFRSFLHSLSKHRVDGKFVQELRLCPRPEGTGLQSPVNEDPSIAHTCEWIHKAFYSLPPLLPDLRSLELLYLPTLHPVSSVMWPRFVNVEDLILDHFKHHSFSELTQLINGFPKLRNLKIRNCTWSKPIRYCCRIGGPKLMRLIYFARSTGVGHPMLDFARWASSSQLVSTLTDLELKVNHASLGFDDILRGCSHHLRQLRLSVQEPDRTWSKWSHA